MLDRLHRVAFYLFMLSGMAAGLSLAIDSGPEGNLGLGSSFFGAMCMISAPVLLALTAVRMVRDEKGDH